MTFLLILAAFAVSLAVGTLWYAVHDGTGPQGPPRSRTDDPRFHSPAAARWGLTDPR